MSSLSLLNGAESLHWSSPFWGRSPHSYDFKQQRQLFMSGAVFLRYCGREREIGLSARAPVLCVRSARPSLDDVERLSRGRPSKSKFGSRAVPHRLNADERKAFELAKKRGFVVHQANSRRYPLVNSHRNYCDALGIPCIRVDQGLGGIPDEVVMDLTTLRLPEPELEAFRGEVIKSVESVQVLEDMASAPMGGESDRTRELSAPKDAQSVESSPNGLGLDSHESTSPDVISADITPLRFQAPSRIMAKRIAQIGVDTWKKWSKANLKTTD